MSLNRQPWQESTTPALIPPSVLTFFFSRMSETSGSGSGGINQWSGDANASWEIDLFGRYRRQREVGKADVSAAIEDVNAARLSLLGKVAEAYVRARGYRARLGIARETLVTWRNTLELTRAKFDAASVSSLQLAQTEAEVASTSAEIPTLETSLHESIMELGVLLGKQPASILPLFKRGGPIPNPRVSVGAGIPANILHDRPDIRKAEKNLASVTTQIGVGLVCSETRKITIQLNQYVRDRRVHNVCSKGQ